MKKSVIVLFVLSAVFAAGTFAGAALRTTRIQEQEGPKPGPEQAVLKHFEGEWDAVTSGMGPDTKGNQSSKMACGGMFLTTTYHGEFGGQPFEGRGLMGFDMEGKTFQNVWVDPMSTKITVDSGTWDEKSKTLSFETKGTSGAQMKMTMTSQDADHYTLKFIGKDEQGQEGEMFKIAYTRKGAKGQMK